MTKMNTLEMTAGNVFNLQDFKQNKIKFKQRSVEDFIGTSFVLIDAELLLIWMNKFQLDSASVMSFTRSCLPC